MDNQIKCLFPLIICWCMTTCCEIRGFHFKVAKAKTPPNKPTASKEVRRLLDCIQSSLLIPKCALACFDKAKGECYVYDSPDSITQNNASKIRKANVRKAAGEVPVLKPNVLVLKRGKMTWHEAERDCSIDGMLHLIDSDVKQRRAAELAGKSGLEYVAIGAYRNGFTWRNIRTHKLNYSAWATGEPMSAGWFAVLSKKKGYKWQAILRQVTGRLCETSIKRDVYCARRHCQG